MNETLAQLSNQFVYAAMAVYTLSFFSFAVSLAATRGSAPAAEQRSPALVGADVTSGQTALSDDVAGVVPLGSEAELAPGRRSGNIAMSLMWLATVLLALGVVLRGFSAGRVPWGNMYEFSITSALAVAVVFLVLSLKQDVRWLGIFVSGAVLLTLGLAITVLYTESAELVPALKSWWLVIHVSAAIVCAGGFTLAAALSGAYLVRDSGEKRSAEGKPMGWLSSRLPSAATLDRMAFRTVAFTFPLWTFAVVAGAIWAENAWGRYWGWDPKETWAFITWVIFAGYLHARSTTGWRGRRAAWIAIVGFLAFLFNYFGVNLFLPGLHSYAGV